VQPSRSPASPATPGATVGTGAVDSAPAPLVTIAGHAPIECKPAGREGTGAHFCELNDAHVFEDGSYVVGGAVWGQVEIGGKSLRAKSRQNTLLLWVSAAGKVERTVLMGTVWDNDIQRVSAGVDRSVMVSGLASNGFHPQFPRSKKDVDDERPFVAVFAPDGKVRLVRGYEDNVVDVKAAADGYVAVGTSGLVKVFGNDGKERRNVRLPLAPGEFIVKAIVASGTDIWTVSMRPIPPAPPLLGGYEILATHHVGDAAPRVISLSRDTDGTWSQAYGGAFQGDVLVAASVPAHVEGGPVRQVAWWRVNDSGIVWSAAEPVATRPGDVADVNLRGAAVTDDGISTIVAYVLAGRKTQTIRVLHHEAASGRLAWDARPVDAALGDRVSPLVLGGERPLLTPTARGLLIMGGNKARGMDPFAQLEHLEVER